MSKSLKSLKNRYEQLLEEVKLHDRLYYKEASPKISDFEYDCLKAELERLFRALSSQMDLPSASAVGDDKTENFVTRRHHTPMTSLSNTYSLDELLQFDHRVQEMLHGQPLSYIVEPKIDGVAIDLVYKRGELQYALTRGDGATGDDVTENILTIENFPKTIPSEEEWVEVRGEVYINEATFLKVNQEREENGDELFANPRNLAAGTIKTLEINEVRSRHLRLIAYAIGEGKSPKISTQKEVLEQLRQWKFPSQERYWVAHSIQKAWENIQELDRVRHDFSYWTDGAVVKVNECSLWALLGATAKSPRWAMAYKYAPERAKTTVRSIVLQVGRTGIVTPVADLVPVMLSGSCVSRATLHNAEDLAHKDIREGDEVVVEKAGEIIPAIVEVNTGSRGPNSTPYQFPERCPSCGSLLVQLPGEVAWRCQNSECVPQIVRRIQHFVSREAMNIDGIGPVLIEKLVQQKKLRNSSDLYRLKMDDLMSLENCGPKSALKLLEAIDSSKNRPLWRLIYGLGIPHVGAQTAKDMAHHFSSMEALKVANILDLAQVDGIGNVVASSIVTFLSDEHNQEILKHLEDEGVSMSDAPQAEQETSKPLAGKTFVLTGTLEHLTRREATELIESCGGRLSESVSKKIFAVIVGENSGSKKEKAESLHIPLWTEERLLEECHRNLPPSDFIFEV